MDMVRVLAFDPGTASTGFAVVEGDLLTSDAWLHKEWWGVLKTKKTDGSVRERIDEIGDQMRKLVRTTAPSHIAVEDFTEQGKRTGTVYKEMSWLIEHMRMVGRELGHEVTIYENGEWKKITMGTAGLNKNQIKHYVEHHLKGTEVLLNKRTATHVWDSAGIGYAKIKQLQGAHH